MDRDYFSIHAQAPWTGAPSERQNDEKVPRKQESGRHLRGSGDTPEQIQFCLVCKRPVCVNCMHRLKKGEVPAKERPASPCMTCPTQRMCQDRGWTCADKRQWEETYG